jgi:hypothetical protein
MADDNIAVFQADLKRFAELTGRAQGDIVRFVALKIFRQFVAGDPHNPVDTGFSRGNWNLGIGAPDESVRGERPKRKAGEAGGEVFPAPPDPNVSDVDGKQPVYITNSVEYVQYLEDGTSTQAPHGFIAIGLAKVEYEVNTEMEKYDPESGPPAT